MLSLHDYKHLVDEAIQLEYSVAIERAQAIDGSYGDLLREMSRFIGKGGKRIRPYLAYLAYVGFGGQNTQMSARAGASLELLHNFLLIHDDIIDRDLVRYGGPNVQGAYLHKLRGSLSHDAEHGAASAAILAGDVACSLAHTVIYELEIDDTAKLRILRALSDAVFVTGGGEMVDSLAGALNHANLTEDQIYSVYLSKTAHYTFYLPLRVAAAMAGKDSSIDSLLLELAQPIGLAYQMRDDYLGLFGDPEKTGKPITGDIREGKQTIYFALMQKNCSEQDRVELDQIYGSPSASEKEVYRVREICEKCGAKDQVEAKIHELYDDACSKLAEIGLSEEARTAMQEILYVSTHRHE